MTLKESYTSDKGGYLFIKAGSIIPMWENVQYVSEKPVKNMIIRIYPDKKGEYILYEDDGISFAFEDGVFAKTKIAYETNDRSISVSINQVDGSFPIPDDRIYHLEVYTEAPGKLPAFASYDKNKKAILFSMKSGEKITIK